MPNAVFRPAPRVAARVSLVAGLTALALTPASLAVAAQPTADQLEQRVQSAERRLEAVVEEYNDLREGLRDTRERIAELDARSRPLEQEIDAQRAEAGRVAADAYRTGGGRTGATLATVLTSGSTDGVVEPLLLLHRFGRDRRQVIDRLGDAHQRLAKARAEASTLAERLTAQQRQLSERRKRIRGDLAKLHRLRQQSGISAERPPATDGRLPEPTSAGVAGRAVRFAFAQLGKPYQWGAEGPGSYDCSGLTSAAWAAAGVRLPHNAARQWAAVTRISRAERRPGDLVFYYQDIQHVGIYVGQGKIIHAPRTGERIRFDLVDFQPVRGYGRPH